MKHHYHVLFGLTGCYMPDDNSGPYRTRKEAEAYAVDLARRCRDEGEKVWGSAKQGYYLVGRHNCIEITVCGEEECNDDNPA